MREMQLPLLIPGVQNPSCKKKVQAHPSTEIRNTACLEDSGKAEETPTSEHYLNS